MPSSSLSREEVEHSLRGMAFNDNLSSILVKHGVVMALCQVLRVTLDLAQHGPSIVEHERHHPSSGQHGASFPVTTPFRDNFSLANIEMWPMILFLQCEILIGLGSSAAAHPREALEDLCLPASRSTLFNVLSFSDLQGHVPSGHRLRAMGGKRLEELYWERTELILEFIRECIPIVTACSKSGTSRKIAPRDFMSVLKGLPLAIDRIGTLFPTEEEVAPGHRWEDSGNCTCSVECLPNVHSPPYIYDLWPWNEGRRYDQHDKERRRRSAYDESWLKSSCTTYCLSDISLVDQAASFDVFRKEKRPHWTRAYTQSTIITSLFAHLLNICELSSDSGFSSASSNADPKDLGSLVG